MSPDVGGVARARAFAKKLSDAPLAIVDKRRQGHNVAEVSEGGGGEGWGCVMDCSVEVQTAPCNEMREGPIVRSRFCSVAKV